MKHRKLLFSSSFYISLAHLMHMMKKVHFRWFSRILSHFLSCICLHKQAFPGRNKLQATVRSCWNWSKLVLSLDIFFQVLLWEWAELNKPIIDRAFWSTVDTFFALIKLFWPFLLPINNENLIRKWSKLGCFT